MRKIRTALSDDAEKPRFLETVIGKDYRFIEPMRVISPLFLATHSRDDAEAAEPPASASHGARDPPQSTDGSTNYSNAFLAFFAAFFCLRGSRALFFFAGLAAFGLVVFAGAGVVIPTAAATLPAAVPMVLAAATSIPSDVSLASLSLVICPTF